MLVCKVILRGNKNNPRAITDIILLEAMTVMNMRQVCNMRQVRAELLACCPGDRLYRQVKQVTDSSLRGQSDRILYTHHRKKGVR